MDSATYFFTVVIASRCDDARSELLRRACESVCAMAGGLEYSILVVANGPHVSARVLEWLATRRDTRVVRLRSGSYPLARRVGAELADSEFLSFLDDVDELLPDTLPKKIEYFREHPEIDVLFTDGLRINGDTVTKVFPPLESRSADLVESLMHAGWNAGALTLRTKNVDLKAFDAEFRHLEWTLTTLELARRHPVGFLDEPMYSYHEDTPNSLWKSADHSLAGPALWRRLWRSYAGTRWESVVRKRYGSMCHIAASELARRGHMRAAWRFHLQSLRSSKSLTYLPYSARLAWYSVRNVFVRTGSSEASTI